MSDGGQQSVEAKLEKLRPTQVTVGYDEVAFKRRQWVAQSDEDKARFLSEHPFPAVLGPHSEYYIIDGHHLGRALLEAGVDVAPLSVIENLSHLSPAEFWSVMNRRGLTYPYDAQGRRRDFEQMPESLGELTDDPFRSLAAQVRREGGYAKDPTPFAEFKCANYLRDHLSFAALRAYPERALKCAMKLMRDGASKCSGRFGAVSKPSTADDCPSAYLGVRLCDEPIEAQ